MGKEGVGGFKKPGDILVPGQDPYVWQVVPGPPPSPYRSERSYGSLQCLIWLWFALIMYRVDINCDPPESSHNKILILKNCIIFTYLKLIPNDVIPR